MQMSWSMPALQRDLGSRFVDPSWTTEVRRCYGRTGRDRSRYRMRQMGHSIAVLRWLCSRLELKVDCRIESQTPRCPLCLRWPRIDGGYYCHRKSRKALGSGFRPCYRRTCYKNEYGYWTG